MSRARSSGANVGSAWPGRGPGRNAIHAGDGAKKHQDTAARARALSSEAGRGNDARLADRNPSFRSPGWQPSSATPAPISRPPPIARDLSCLTSRFPHPLLRCSLFLAFALALLSCRKTRLRSQVGRDIFQPPVAGSIVFDRATSWPRSPLNVGRRTLPR